MLALRCPAAAWRPTPTYDVHPSCLAAHHARILTTPFDAPSRAQRRYRDFEISSADGSRIATLHRVRHGVFVLRRASSAGSAHPELAAVTLGERQVIDAPSRPALNHMRLAAGRLTLNHGAGGDGLAHDLHVARIDSSDDAAAALDRLDLGQSSAHSVASRDAASVAALGLGGPIYSKMLARPAGELLKALDEDAPPPPASTVRWHLCSSQPSVHRHRESGRAVGAGCACMTTTMMVVRKA